VYIFFNEFVEYILLLNLKIRSSKNNGLKVLIIDRFRNCLLSTCFIKKVDPLIMELILVKMEVFNVLTVVLFNIL
jgi:hypothetical protein